MYARAARRKFQAPFTPRQFAPTTSATTKGERGRKKGGSEEGERRGEVSSSLSKAATVPIARPPPFPPFPTLPVGSAEETGAREANADGRGIDHLGNEMPGNWKSLNAPRLRGRSRKSPLLSPSHFRRVLAARRTENGERIFACCDPGSDPGSPRPKLIASEIAMQVRGRRYQRCVCRLAISRAFAIFRKAGQ